MTTPVVSAIPWVFAFSMQAEQSIVVDPKSPGGVVRTLLLIASRHGARVSLHGEAASFLSLTGYDRKEVLGHSFNFLIARGADPEAVAQVEAAFEGSTDHGSEIRYRRKDGSMFWAAIFISPVLNESGDVEQHFASFVDLTKQKLRQAQSTMMINELNHRVKNTLSTVQSIVWQALRASDPKVIPRIIRVSPV